MPSSTTRVPYVGALLAVLGVGAAFVVGGARPAPTSSAGAPVRDDVAAQAPPSPAAAQAQVSGVAARHRSGQTFVTWQELGPPPPATLTMKDLRDRARDLEERRVSYRVYRSTRPIERLADATLIGERPALSGWDLEHYGRGQAPAEPAFRFVIQDGQPPLEPGSGLLVLNPSAAGAAYYAVTAVVNGNESKTVTDANRVGPVDETTGSGTPVLQRTDAPTSFFYVENPKLQFYVRWEPPGNASESGRAFDYLVAIPPDVKYPAPVGVHLHEWGGSLYGSYGWWFNAEKGAVLVASNQEPYDWWTGYHEQFYAGPQREATWTKGVVRPYTQKRLLSFVDWLGTRMSLDPSRMFAGGSSMGGSGALMMAIRYPSRFAWAIGWVGVHSPKDSPQFKSSYETVWGPPEWNVKFEDGTPVWEYFDDAEYVRHHPDIDLGFLTFSNGKNDGAIGWAQAVKFVRALQEARQPHLFVWGQQGHVQRAQMPDGGRERINPLDVRVDQSLPAFTRGSLDGNPGNGDPDVGDPEGEINGFAAWTPDSIRDEPDQWAITLRLAAGTEAESATADITPRRLQRFKVKPGDRVRWTNAVGGRTVQNGEVVADQWGLVTVPEVRVARNGSRLTIVRAAP